MKKHFYDSCDGGICLNCDRCKSPQCCVQTEECEGEIWGYLMIPLEIDHELPCDHPYVSQSWVGYSGYTHCHECGKIVSEDE